MEQAVRLDQLTRHFGRFTAVDRISFGVRRGEVVGFLGPNGAGKSTTMRMLAGYLTPSGGRAQIMGHDVEAEPLEARGALGYLPEGAPLYGDMTPLGLFNFVASMRGMTGATRRHNIATVIDRTDLSEVAYKPIETLSKGFKRRVGLAAAILHDPPVLILDEPTDGLDPNQKHEVRGLIAAMAPDKAIIVSTHILEEVSAVCTRAIVIARGKVVADATPAQLQAYSEWQDAVSLRLPAEQVAQARTALAEVDSVYDVRPMNRAIDGYDLLVVPVQGEHIAKAVADQLAQAGIEIEDFRVETGRLDDVFRKLTTMQPAH
ncbi:MAG TPA: ABC transporter ATP-binding protein [Geminicoccus sp.]|jgi:ABC-2 type transport system ATP-binding protein|uniref:ABC transporter ATP-binding protein n=1 Tax=Geminicoccus sp. TaxID=2024832 RepID=UPI002E3090E1|nr:ABC transporter ATP-binding protein [Geminicoccus sp.]HEX2524766.1 ABC transporter ATP-binding protein [Geminicoccus sp.]